MSLGQNDIKRLRDELRACADRLEWLPDWIWEIDTQGHLTYSNAVVERILGFKPDELIGKSPFSLATPEDEQRCKDVLADAIEHKTGIEHVICWMTAADGSPHAFDVSSVRLIDGKGILTGFRAIARDVTEQMKTQQSAQEATENYRRLVDDSPTGIVVLQDGKVVYSNPQLLQLMGYTAEEAIGADVWGFVHPDDIELVRDNIARRLRGEPVPPRYEVRTITKTGEVLHFWIQATVVSYNGRPAILDNLIDITEQKNAEEELRRRTAELEALVLAYPDLYFWLDEEDRITRYHVPKLSDLYALPEEFLGRTFGEVLPADVGVRSAEVIAEIRRSGKMAAMDYSLQMPGGEQHYEARFALLPEGSILTIVRNITERKRAEEAVRESEQRYRSFLQNFQGVAFRAGLDLRPIFVHGSLEAITGYTEEDLLQGTPSWRALIHPDDLAGFRETMEDLLARPGAEAENQHRVIRKDGQIRWVKSVLRSIADDSGKSAYLQGAIYDITEQKRDQERLTRLNETLLSFGADPKENINRLVGLFGELVGADAALYSRLEHGMLCAWGKWKVGPEHKDIDQPEGHTCYDLIRSGDTGVRLIRNLQQTDYARTAPCVTQYGLQTYMGMAVRFRDKSVGSLCAVFTRDFVPSESDEKLLGVIAGAIAVEEQRKRAEDALQESEEKYRDLIETTDTGYLIVDTQGRVIDANAEYVRLTGRQSLDEIVGHSVLEWTAPYDIERSEQEVKKCAEKGLVRNLNIDYVSPEGRVTPIEMNATVMDSAEGPRILTLCRDVTERRYAETALRNSEERYKVLFDQSPDMVFLVEGDVWVAVNPAVERILGYSPEELIGSYPWSISPELQPDGARSQEKVMRINRGLRENEPVTLEWVHKRKDGSLADCEVSLVAYETHGRTIVQAIVRDVTERKQAEEAKRGFERQVEAQKRQFYRDTILSVTGGKLDICDAPEIREYVARAATKTDVRAPAEVGPARRQVAEFCEASGLKGERLESFVIAFGEALTNAIKHGQQGRVYMGVKNGAVWAGVSDKGKGIESLILPRATLLRGFSTKPSLGLGYSIMLQVVDHILLKTDRRGTFVILIKNIEEPEVTISPELLPDTWDSIPDA